jgi:hypothetical protein
MLGASDRFVPFESVYVSVQPVYYTVDEFGQEKRVLLGHEPSKLLKLLSGLWGGKCIIIRKVVLNASSLMRFEKITTFSNTKHCKDTLEIYFIFLYLEMLGIYYITFIYFYIILIIGILRIYLFLSMCA